MDFASEILQTDMKNSCFHENKSFPSSHFSVMPPIECGEAHCDPVTMSLSGDEPDWASYSPGACEGPWGKDFTVYGDEERLAICRC